MGTPGGLSLVHLFCGARGTAEVLAKRERERRGMKHLRGISRRRPREAQLESLLQLVGLLNSVLSFYVSLANTFGLSIPQKNEEEA